MHPRHKLPIQIGNTRISLCGVAVDGGPRSPLFAAWIKMQATRDFYQKRASELTTLAERAKSKDHRSDLLALAQAWRDLACGWEVDQAPPRAGGFVLRQEKSP